jgi:hypothetical protein
MGTPLLKHSFDETDFKSFRSALTSETALLKKWVKQKQLSAQSKESGLELEGWLLNKDFLPNHSNLKFIESLNDPHWVPEVTDSSLELNSDHYVLQGHVLSAHHDNLAHFVHACEKKALQNNKHVIYIGGLPVNKISYFTPNELTNAHRYYALDARLNTLRQGKPIRLDINGTKESLSLLHQSVAIAGAISAFQIHIRVSLEESARCYNAAQIISAPMIALGCNSPILMGSQLWHENRIPLLEQVFQFNRTGRQSINSRVFFGRKYVKESILELFTENLSFESLLPQLFDTPKETLAHLKLHNGTIYRWNRPVVDFDGDGCPHFRIEHRVLPAGNSIVDMCANLAFFIGLIQALSTQKTPLEHQLAFKNAKNNFYEAARCGLLAQLIWTDNKKISAIDLILKTLLPVAYEGLNQLDVNKDEANFYLAIIEARVRTGKTGSSWQKQFLEKNNGDLLHLIKTYIALQTKGHPVHEWSL